MTLSQPPIHADSELEAILVHMGDAKWRDALRMLMIRRGAYRAPVPAIRGIPAADDVSDLTLAIAQRDDALEEVDRLKAELDALRIATATADDQPWASGTPERSIIAEQLAELQAENAKLRAKTVTPGHDVTADVTNLSAECDILRDCIADRDREVTQLKALVTELTTERDQLRNAVALRDAQIVTLSAPALSPAEKQKAYRQRKKAEAEGQNEK